MVLFTPHKKTYQAYCTLQVFEEVFFIDEMHKKTGQYKYPVKFINIKFLAHYFSCSLNEFAVVLFQL